MNMRNTKRNPRVSIIILNWNGIQDTLNCIESVKNLDCNNLEIIVVDNGSRNDELKELKRIKGIKLIRNKKNLGFAEGNNVGIRYAMKKGADAVFLLNNDTIIKRGALKELSKKLFSKDSIGIVGPKIYYFDGRIVWFAGGKINYVVGDSKQIGDRKIDRGQFDDGKEVDYVTGAAILIKKDVFEKVGLLDEDFFAFYEELDFNVRAKKAGFRILYCPNAVVLHRVSATTGKSSPFMIQLNFRNRLIFMKKHAPSYSWITFPFFYVFDLVSMIIYKSLRHDLVSVKATLTGVFQGLKYKKKNK